MSTPVSLSPEVAGLASRNRLGRLERTFLPKREVAVQEGHRGLFVAVSLAGIACLATGGVLLWVFVSWAFALYPLLITVLAVGALLRSPNAREKVGSRRLYLFEDGMAADMGAGRLFAVRWDQAVHYQETLNQVAAYNDLRTTLQSAHTSTLLAPGGAKVQITHAFADHGTWAPLIAQAITRAQAQRVWESVREGRRVAYGPFELDATGIATKRRGRLPWSAVAAIDVRGGSLFVRQHGQRGQRGQQGQPRAWAHAQVKSVPNFLVFLTIASKLYEG
ncbi:DUF6585 family protein [Streptomyces sp. NPDC006285]|uniref:DUF6585 family protein n=1 Tax=Streptomyces sp. NPDC006285 TaxID=3364742 RepID=UPI00368DEA68